MQCILGEEPTAQVPFWVCLVPEFQSARLEIAVYFVHLKSPFKIADPSLKPLLNVERLQPHPGTWGRKSQRFLEGSVYSSLTLSCLGTFPKFITRKLSHAGVSWHDQRSHRAASSSHRVVWAFAGSSGGMMK